MGSRLIAVHSFSNSFKIKDNLKFYLYRAKLLCTSRIISEFDRANPFVLKKMNIKYWNNLVNRFYKHYVKVLITSGSKQLINETSSLSCAPMSRSLWSQFKSTLRIAWVAQAFSITCLQKIMSSARESLTNSPSISQLPIHLNRKMRPWTGLSRNA